MKEPARNIYKWLGGDFRVYFPIGKTSVLKRLLNRAVKEVVSKVNAAESRRRESRVEHE